MTLRIPSKTLEDKFKLKDFQMDYSELLELLELSVAQPVQVNHPNFDEMEFVYSNGARKLYRFVKSNNLIVRVINLTDNKVTEINR